MHPRPLLVLGDCPGALTLGDVDGALHHAFEQINKQAAVWQPNALECVGGTMVRPPSSPERRAQDLLARADLSLRRNDGSTDPVRFFFDARRRGTSVIKEDDLYRDGAGARPKSFHWVTPDFLGEDFAFEIKGNVSGKGWDALSRDATNDHFRFALLRVRFGAVTDRRLEFASLAANEQRVVTEALKPWPQAAPESRLYVRWDDVKSVAPSPNDNLQRDTLRLRNVELPIKRITGVTPSKHEDYRAYRAFYVLDSETMKEWESKLGMVELTRT